MLSESDAALIERDPSVSGLKLLLDDVALVAALSEKLPQLKIIGAHTEYLRYKPGVSCLARIRLHTATDELSAYAVAYHSKAPDKLSKAAMVRDAAGTMPTLLGDHSIVVYPFPLDRRLVALRRFANRSSIRELICRTAPKLMDTLPEPGGIELTTLRYKPERRFVGRLASAGQPFAAVKIYSKPNYPLAKRASKAIGGAAGMSHARWIGHSDRHAALLFRWIEGTPLSDLADDSARAEQLVQAARTLHCLHTISRKELPTTSVTSTVQRLWENGGMLSWIDGRSADEVRATSEVIAKRLLESKPGELVPVHGDLHLQQFIVGDDGPQLIDFDRARLADPAEDLGSLYANLRRRAIDSASKDNFDALFDRFLNEYADAGGEVDVGHVHLYAAFRLMELAIEPFRTRRPNWMDDSRRFIKAAQELVDSSASYGVARFSASRTALHGDAAVAPRVDDPFQLANDQGLPMARYAMDPQIADQRLGPLAIANGERSEFELNAIRVLRHKPGRRCLIEYQGHLMNADDSVSWLGKMHAKPRHAQSFARQQALWSAGFHAECADRICVAKPLGVIPEWNMWLQSAVPGESSWSALEGPIAAHVARRIVEAAHKLHCANVRTSRAHTLSDELAILSEHLPLVAEEMPMVRDRLRRIRNVCHDLAETISLVPAVGIHRDFYPDHVLVDGDRLFVVDHDLYAMGDPRLDIGNFCGHLVESSIRRTGHPHLYDSAASVMVDHFAELDGGGDACRYAIHVYTLLTLARHVYLSRRFSKRHATTMPLMELVEDLASAAPQPTHSLLRR